MFNLAGLDVPLDLPCDVRFGAGRARELGVIAASFGRPRVLVVTGRRALAEGGALDRLFGFLREGTEGIVHYRLEGGEPGPRDVDDGAALARSERCGLVVGIGGGAALDAAKAVAAMAPLNAPVEAYLEGVGDGRTIDAPGLPCIAVPTTGGTGAEVTRNSVLGSRERRYKRSVRSIHLVPRAAIVDPDLTVSAPPHVTASSGMDAIVQLIESYVSRNAQPVTDALVATMMGEAVPALERAFADGGDLAARAVMARAALYSGVCLSHAGLGVVHALSSSVGALTGVPHGVACARMVPESIRANARALAEAGPGEEGGALRRLGQVGRWVMGRGALGHGGVATDPLEDALAGADRLAELVRTLAIPRFRDYGLTEADAAAIATGPLGTSMRSNPAALDGKALEAIVRSAL